MDPAHGGVHSRVNGSLDFWQAGGTPAPRLAAEGDGGLQRGEAGFLARGEFLAEPAGVADFVEAGANGFVVELLRVIQLVPSGHAGSVEVGDAGVMLANGGDDIAFHDLHVIDVVQQAEVR